MNRSSRTSDHYISTAEARCRPHALALGPGGRSSAPQRPRRRRAHAVTLTNLRGTYNSLSLSLSLLQIFTLAYFHTVHIQYVHPHTCISSQPQHLLSQCTKKTGETVNSRWKHTWTRCDKNRRIFGHEAHFDNCCSKTVDTVCLEGPLTQKA